MPARAPATAPLGWRLAYQAAATAAAAAALPVTAVAALLNRPWAVGLGERLGAAPRADGRPAWFHCASVGEQRAFEPVARELASRRPGLPVVLSVTTPAGRQAAARLAPWLSAPAFQVPADAWPLPGRAIDRVAPRLLALVETELWPNLLTAARRRGVPVAIVNGRLEERSFRRYRRAGPLFRPLLARLELLAMRSEADAERALALGAPADRVHVTGNTKFDEAARLAREEEPLPWAQTAGLGEGRWLVGGSTAEGEESLLLAAFRDLRSEAPELRLALAPRRPERWDAVAELVRECGLELRRRSLWTGEADGPVPPGGVLLLDSVGELARLYRHAEVAFVGGTLVPRGGQNPLEAAAAGRPVLVGPHGDHFRDVERSLELAGGLVRVRTENLKEEIAALLADDDRRRLLGEAAREAVLAGEGAARRTVELLVPLLDAGSDEP